MKTDLFAQSCLLRQEEQEEVLRLPGTALGSTKLEELTLCPTQPILGWGTWEKGEMNDIPRIVLS